MDTETFDQQAFDLWLAGDPRRLPVFDAMRRRLMGSEMDAALHAYQRRGANRRALVAGGVALLLVGGISVAALPTLELHFAQPQGFAVAQGAVRTVTLADGTRLTLAAGADIQVRYTGRARLIALSRGTLFADVAHDAKRPFRIVTGDADIIDVGTSFEVLSRPGNVRVAVASGSVRFGRNGWFDTPISLTARQAATLDDKGLTRTADVDPAAIARWRSEWMEYKGAPLRQVVADLQSLSPAPIEIADAALADKPVSGRIRLTDPVEQLQNLAIIHAFRVQRTNDRLLLSKN